MKKSEILKRARDILAGLIAHNTPDPKVACAKALQRLSEISEIAKAMQPGEVVGAPFAMGVNDVIGLLDAFRSGYASNDASQTVAGETAAETKRNAERIGKAVDAKLAKEMDPSKDAAAPVAAKKGKDLNAVEFAAYLKTTVDGALASNTAECLKRLHALHNAIEKAMAADVLAGQTNPQSFEETVVFTVAVDTDANQIVPTDATQSAAANQVAAPAADSNFAAAPGGAAPGSVAGNEQNGSVMAEAAKNSGPDDVLKSLSETVEKAASKRAESNDIGWTNDLASEEFMTGIRRVDFGRDGSK